MILILAKLIGILIVAMCVVFVVSPQLARPYAAYFRQGKRIYWGGVIRLIFAAILLLAAPDCRWSGLIIVMGVLFLIGGILLFLLKPEKTGSIIEWFEKQSDTVVRVWCGAGILFGALILLGI